MKGLIACESSGIVREAFRKKGIDVMSCDLLDTEIPGPHYKGDVMDILYDGWDFMIAFPPCTFLSNSGVRWLYNPDGSKNNERWESMREGAEFFRTLLNAPIPFKRLENPIQHKYARRIIGRKYDQIIHPWQFGHGETKATCLWNIGFANLIPTSIVEGREQRIWKLPPGPDRWKERSRTFQGIADAMADQFLTQSVQLSIF